MRSPFPGMDPWLESRWRDVHTRFMVYAADELQAQLPSDLVVQVEEGVSVDYGDDQRSIAPDVHVAEQPAETRVGIAPTAQASHVAEPLIVTADEPVTERHLEILDLSGNRVVTAIELLSPSNKMPWEGREKYLQKQGEYLAAGVNLVEIDLIRSGMFTVAAMQKNIRIRFGDAEVYPIPLRERLPTIRVPLRPTDGDVTLNLQRLLEMCYERGRYLSKLSYEEPCDPPLEGDDARWADELLRAAGLRK